MPEVASSNIASIDYDLATRGLVVQFRTGAVYRYEQVPEAVYQSFMQAGSKGQFLARNIKGNYPYSRVA